MIEHIRGLSISHWTRIGFRTALSAFALRVFSLLVLNMGLTLTIFGPLLTMVLLWLLSMALWFCAEEIIDILDPRCVAPHGYGEQETSTSPLQGQDTYRETHTVPALKQEQD